MTSRVVLIGGGVRSGKSAFAVTRALAEGERRAFVATAQAFDDEMRERIDAHRLERSDRFTTFEEPNDLEGALERARGFDVIVVDCLTLWISNLLLAELDDQAVRGRIESLARALDAATCSVLLVTNEVGLGIVPDNALARRFRDLAGYCHQRLASRADEVYFGAMGLLLRLRPSPVVALTPGSET